MRRQCSGCSYLGCQSFGPRYPIAPAGSVGDCGGADAYVRPAAFHANAIVMVGSLGFRGWVWAGEVRW